MREKGRESYFLEKARNNYIPNVILNRGSELNKRTIRHAVRKIRNL